MAGKLFEVVLMKSALRYSYFHFAQKSGPYKRKNQLDAERNQKKSRLTHADNLLMVPIGEVVVKCVPSRTRAHLLGARCDMINICPSSFRRLAICPADERSVVERVGRLAFVDVSGEVKLGHHENEFELCRIKMIFRWKEEHPFPEMYTPLTADIV